MHDEIILEALKYVKDALGAYDYICDTVAKTQHIPADIMFSKADLGWGPHSKRPKDAWLSYAPPSGDDKRTRTLPCMSAEVISRCRLFRLYSDKRSRLFVHDAIHDMETLFWVLVETCLTRSWILTLKHTTTIHTVAVFIYFDATELQLQVSKRDVVASPKKLEGSSFAALKPLVRKWWSILLLGYKYRGDEFHNIHGHIRHILLEALAP
ncbi:hypothetical protein H0H87_005726 [Tephrocybe sp. NHM501043]|nr:hypothetical protein H0H87_005726 [Tephrocybe sp. NHM501043]